jgi:hypothetical protein
VEPFTPTAAEAAQYAGRYVSDEAEATITVVADGGVLRTRDRLGDLRPLTPVYKDAFASGGSILTFIRDAAGKVVALSAGSDRAWSVRFDNR